VVNVEVAEVVASVVVAMVPLLMASKWSTSLSVVVAADSAATMRVRALAAEQTEKISPTWSTKTRVEDKERQPQPLRVQRAPLAKRESRSKFQTSARAKSNLKIVSQHSVSEASKFMADMCAIASAS